MRKRKTFFKVRETSTEWLEVTWYIPGDIWRSVLEDLKESISPRYRKWNSARKMWYVHEDLSNTLYQKVVYVYFQPKQYIFIGWKEEDTFEEWETVSDYSQPNGSLSVSTLSEAYKTLYLVDSAPLWLVEGVYKVLMKHLHPDLAGGSNTEVAARINLAIEKIRKG